MSLIPAFAGVNPLRLNNVTIISIDALDTRQADPTMPTAGMAIIGQTVLHVQFRFLDEMFPGAMAIADRYNHDASACFHR